MSEELLPFCECGECGLRVTKKGNRFIHGHYNKGRSMSNEQKEKISKSHIQFHIDNPEAGSENSARQIQYHIDNPEAGKLHSAQLIQYHIDNPEAGKLHSEKLLKEKTPLSDGWESKKSTTNKKCPTYLGNLSEQLLSKIFKDVKVMPPHNHGYDFICGNGYEIDVKGSAIGYKGHWIFSINKNIVADFFLCIAFESREDLTPIHLWLIPGYIVNHLTNIDISKTESNLAKWSQYEQPIDKAILCCNEMKEGNQ